MSLESIDSSQDIYNSNCIRCSTEGVGTNIHLDRIGSFVVQLKRKVTTQETEEDRNVCKKKKKKVKVTL